MIKILLDSNVVSELRKPDSKRDPNVTKWTEQIDFRNAYLSVVTLYEAEIGILRLKKRDPKQAQHLQRWFEEKVLGAYHGRMLPVTSEIARKAAGIQALAPHQAPDAFIAATALSHSLTLITRNVSDFLDTGVQIVNPWEPGVTYASVRQGQAQ